MRGPIMPLGFFETVNAVAPSYFVGSMSNVEERDCIPSVLLASDTLAMIQ